MDRRPSAVRAPAALFSVLGCAVVLASSQLGQRPASGPFHPAPTRAPVFLTAINGKAAATFGPGGGVVYFTRRDGSGNAVAIVESRFVGGEWQRADACAFSGSFSNLDPFAARDGSGLVFVSFRPPSWNMDLWFARRTAAGWDRPLNLGPGVNSEMVERSPSLSARGTLYFVRGDRIFSAARAGDDYPASAPLPLAIRGGRVIDAAVSPDERYLVFSGDLAGGVSPSDLYVTVNGGSRGWSAPRSVGRPVNTGAENHYPGITADGKYLYFSSNRDGVEGIYYVSADGLAADAP
jgi:hypothetical protein